MYSYNHLHLEEHNPEHYQSFHPNPTPSSNPYEPGISLISHKGTGGKRRPLDNTYYSSNTLGSSSLRELSNPYKHGNMGPSSIRRYLSPGVSGPPEWPLNTGHQAKRARVENIIRGMTGSRIRDVTMQASQDERPVNMQGDKRTPECPQLRHYDHLERSGGDSASRGSPGNHNVKKETHGIQITLRQPQGSFALEDKGRECEVGKGTVEQNHLTWDDCHNTSPQDTLTGPHDALVAPSDETYQGRKRLTLMNYFKSKPDMVNKLMADLLKHELSQALSARIDSISKHMPLLHRPPNGNVGLLTDKHLHLQEGHSPFCKESSSSLSCPERTQGQVPQVQTDALSLVVKKSPPATSHHVAHLLPLARAHHHPRSSLPFSCHLAMHEDKALEKIPRNSPQHKSLGFFQDGNPGAGPPTMDAVDIPWSPVKIRTKVNSSRSTRSPKTSMAMNPKMIYECAPHVKMECDTVKNNVYVLNECLTTNHLKKAKLMFFFTRYPRSPVLKTFFHDVQFTRCITSQLIKWFSNFREFYYIQMEKHARHALMEGVADVRDLTVGRESQLFRALNMHYNKANDFQVPDRFLEVAEITVREFYTAILMGKDCDPSWKKAIYKGICKLDSDIPSEFKSQP